MKKNNATTTAKKQRKQAAAKTRRVRRKEKLATLVNRKLKGAGRRIQDLTMQLKVKDREIAELKGILPAEEIKHDEGSV